MVIAQISDLHLTRAGIRACGQFDTAASLQRCIAHIRALRPLPDVVLATGDLCDEGLPEEYARLRSLLGALHMPVYVIPGNHDRRELLREAFADRGYLPSAGPLCYAVEAHAVRFVALDTLVEGEDGGRLDAAQTDWLDTVLSASPHRPTVVLMHHPPAPSGLQAMDRIGLAAGAAERLAAVVRRHRQVERIVCGHVHRGVQTAWSGTLVSVCPSTAFQCALDLDVGEFEPAPHEPPAYQVHHWRPGAFATHTISVS